MPDNADDEAVEIRVTESRTVPWLGGVLGYGAIAPLWIGALAALLTGGGAETLVTDLSIVWGGAILTFLSGVHRGISFRTMHGPTTAQLVVTFWLYALGFFALAALLDPARVIALLLLLVGFGSLVVIDPVAAQHGEAPLYFGRLRPIQMGLATVAVVVLLLRAV